MMVVAASITHSNCESVAVTLPLMLNRAWKTMNGRIVPVIPIPAVPTHVVRRLLPSPVQCWLPSRWRGPVDQDDGRSPTGQISPTITAFFLPNCAVHETSFAFQTLLRKVCRCQPISFSRLCAMDPNTLDSERLALRQRRLLGGLSFVIVALTAVASLLGLIASWPYQEETDNWVLQARGQDIGNLLAVVVLTVSAVRMRAGSSRAAQWWMGTLFYLLYAYIVYAFAVHFSRLFLVYVAILGFVFFTLVIALSARERASGNPSGRARLFAAWVLIGTGALFALLWLSELIPATVTGQVPPSLTAAGLIVSPIHVIDLSVVLPGMIVIGVLTLRGNKAGLMLSIPALVFSVLMGSSIVAAMMLAVAAGELGGLIQMVMVAIVVVASLVAAIAYGRRMDVAPTQQWDPRA